MKKLRRSEDAAGFIRRLHKSMESKKTGPVHRSPLESAAPPKLPPFDEQVDFCTLSAYGVTGEEAWRAITTSRQAHERLISKRAFGTDRPPTLTPLEWVIFCCIKHSSNPAKELAEILANPFWRKQIGEDVAGFIRRLHETVAQLEWLIFSCIKHSSDPAKELAEILADPFWKEQINKDAAGFIRRLHEFMESKKTEPFDVIDGLLIIGWTRCLLKRLPPFCLATDRLLGLVVSRPEEVIRQRIARLKLYRPTRPRISGREIIKGNSFISIEERRKAFPVSQDDFIQFVRRNFFSGDKVRPSRDRKS